MQHIYNKHYFRHQSVWLKT